MFVCERSNKKIWLNKENFHVLIIIQGCALAEPGGPWCLTFVLGRLENLFFIQIIMLGTLDVTGFLRTHVLLTYSSLFIHDDKILAKFSFLHYVLR